MVGVVVDRLAAEAKLDFTYDGILESKVHSKILEWSRQSVSYLEDL